MRALIAVAFLAACAHTPDLPLRTDDAPPAGSTADVFVARDGTRLLARHWPAAGDARGVLVIMHGLKDHSARYAELATRLALSGYAVYAFDLRGHGRSAGPRVAPPAWMDYVDDLDRFLTDVEAKEPGKPVFLFGHSMGGAIATLVAERHQPRLAGLLLSGPALAIDAPPLLIAVTRMSGALTPNFPALKLANRDFSSDPAVVRAIDGDPLVSQPPAPARTAAGLVDGMRRAWADVDRLTMPLLAMHGSRDKLTAPSASRALIRAAPAADKTLRIYDGFFHDLLHEPDHARVENDLLAWLDAHTGGAPVEPPPIPDGHLRGDPRGWTQAVQLGAGIVTGDGSTDVTGELSLQLARPRPLGWHGALTARIAGEIRSIALRPLGLAVRAGPAIAGLSGGGALVDGGPFALSGGAWLELPAGPLHASAVAEWWRLGGKLHDGPLAGDLLTATVSLRVPGDRAYWPHARAGVGPYVSGGLAFTGDAHAFLVTAGLALYGAD